MNDYGFLHPAVSYQRYIVLAVAATVGIIAATRVSFAAHTPSPGVAADGHGLAFAHSIPTNIQPSFVSFVVKTGAKRVSKGTLKSFIKTRIKDRLGKLMDKKLARELAEEADQILGILNDPWWVTGIGFIPIAGDAFDLARVPSQIRKALRRADALEDKVQAALDAEHKAQQAAQVASSAARHVPAQAPPAAVISQGVRASRAVPDLGRKLDFLLGKATGSAHNIERSMTMLRQLRSIGLGDTSATRQLLGQHFDDVLNNAGNIVRSQANGRVVRESTLVGPKGIVKVESVWEGKKLITVILHGGRP